MFRRATIRLGIGPHSSIFMLWFVLSFFLFFLSSFFFFCSPNHSGRRLDVYHTLEHGVALVRIYNAMLSSNISSTCPHNMVNFDLLAAEIVSLVWGTPGNFNGFLVLAALLHGTLAVGVSQTAAF